MEGDSLNGVDLRLGDCLTVMKAIPDGSVNCCVTSPPYFGLRDYGVDGQIGLEPTPDEFVSALVAVFREVRRVLREDGTVWLNLGDSYAGAGYSNHTNTGGAQRSDGGKQRHLSKTGVKNKDLIGIPWRVAFALQADGWYLRQDIIWHKPNPMPESVRDRCTKAHEYVFLLSKSQKYYYDNNAVKEPVKQTRVAPNQNDSGAGKMRNRRSVWTVATKPYKGAHFATFPPDLIEPCILAGSPKGGVVLDPFGGSGTTAGVAVKHGRKAILCELNPEYANLVRERVGIIAGNCAISNSAPLNDNNRTEMSPLKILIQRALAA